MMHLWLGKGVDLLLDAYKPNSCLCRLCELVNVDEKETRSFRKSWARSEEGVRWTEAPAKGPRKPWQKAQQQLNAPEADAGTSELEDPTMSEL